MHTPSCAPCAAAGLRRAAGCEAQNLETVASTGGLLPQPPPGPDIAEEKRYSTASSGPPSGSVVQCLGGMPWGGRATAGGPTGRIWGGAAGGSSYRSRHAVILHRGKHGDCGLSCRVGVAV